MQALCSVIYKEKKFLLFVVECNVCKFFSSGTVDRIFETLTINLEIVF